MHWVIQKSIYRAHNLAALIDALEFHQVPHTLVEIPVGTIELVPDINPEGRVFVCGALKMAQIAKTKGWQPGSLLTEQFHHAIWQEYLSDYLLNADAQFCKFSELHLNPEQQYFIRPASDTKLFDGGVFYQEMVKSWQNTPAKKHLANSDVMVSSFKPIQREYRLFIVNNQVVTGSLYKLDKQNVASPLVGPDVIEFANKVIAHWLPAESCVMDVALTEQGLKVIEFNNINSSGFYASNVRAIVDALEQAYA